VCANALRDRPSAGVHTETREPALFRTCRRDDALSTPDPDGKGWNVETSSLIMLTQFGIQRQSDTRMPRAKRCVGCAIRPRCTAGECLPHGIELRCRRQPFVDSQGVGMRTGGAGSYSFADIYPHIRLRPLAAPGLKIEFAEKRWGLIGRNNT
jgi:hypothetical protein